MVKTLRAVGRELRAAFRLAADARSFLRCASDVLLYRLLRVVSLPARDRERSIRLRGDVCLTYRLNRGDIQSLREVWMDEAYRLPFDLKPEVVIDLGANIGLTSVWLARRYNCRAVVAVEPSPANAALARRNLRDNGIAAEVVEGAVGPRDGIARFQGGAESNVGKIAARGVEVPMLSMDSVLRRVPGGPGTGPGRADLVKLDIEGGEQDLLTQGDLGWLGRVRALIVEFHPTLVDYPGLVAAVRRAGFRYVPAGSAHPDSMDAFVREEAV